MLCREFEALKTNKDIMNLGHSYIPGGFRPMQTVAENRKDELKGVFPAAKGVPNEDEFEIGKGGPIVSEKEEIFAFCHPHIFPFGTGDPNSKRLNKVHRF
jgi:hypothetical protein